MPNGLPEPALLPLHPDKPEPPIVAGDVWVKKASGKTSVNAPRCKVVSVTPGRVRRVTYSMLTPMIGATSRVTERVFRRDWTPC